MRLCERERQRDRETERQRDRETERQRDRETERQRDRETERQRDRETERGRKGKENMLAGEGMRPFCGKQLLMKHGLPAQSPERKALSLVVVGSSPTVGVAQLESKVEHFLARERETERQRDREREEREGGSERERERERERQRETE